jgi:alpha-beta hydrolase superfamily lysophospholipase
MVREVELRIDVSDAVGLGEPAHIAATVVLPEPALLAERAMVCFAKPGGSYSRGYYTCALPGPGEGAQAAWHAERGWIFAALDTLGCGSSSRHDPEALDFRAVSAAAAAAEQEILLRLANGVLLAGYPPVHQPVVIGIGQSLGGSLVVYQQAHHSSYDGIAVLGFSAVHSHPTTPPGGAPIVVAWYARDPAQGRVPTPLNARALAEATANGPQEPAWPALAWGFHYDDVPQDVVEQDLLHYEAAAHGADESGTFEPAPWMSLTTPHNVARLTLTPGAVAIEAAAVAVPVLCAMGVRDLVVDPLGETRAFRSAPSVDLFICPRLGHMHNFGGTRALFWERIHSFGAWCAAMKAAG